MNDPKHGAERMRAVTQEALPHMSRAIARLRNAGHHDLADELTTLKEDWARTVMHAAGQHERGLSFVPPLERRRRHPALAKANAVERPKLRVVVGGGERA